MRTKIVVATALSVLAPAYAAESIVVEHSQDIVKILLWAVTGLLSALIAVAIAYVASKFSDRNSRFEKALLSVDKRLEKFEGYLRTEISGVKADARQDRLRIHAVELECARTRERLRVAGVPQPVDYVTGEYGGNVE